MGCWGGEVCFVCFFLDICLGRGGGKEERGGDWGLAWRGKMGERGMGRGWDWDGIGIGRGWDGEMGGGMGQYCSLEKVESGD